MNMQDMQIRKCPHILLLFQITSHSVELVMIMIDDYDDCGDITSWAHRNTESSEQSSAQWFLVSFCFVVGIFLYILTWNAIFENITSVYSGWIRASERAFALARFFIRVWRNCWSMKATWRRTWWSPSRSHRRTCSGTLSCMTWGKAEIKSQSPMITGRFVAFKGKKCRFKLTAVQFFDKLCVCTGICRTLCWIHAEQKCWETVQGLQKRLPHGH